MQRIVRWIVAGACLSLAMGMADAQAQTVAPAPVVVAPPPPVLIAPPAPPVDAAAAPRASLPGSVVFVYSYLDLRDDHFGAKMLDFFDHKLTEGLDGLKIGSKIVRYKSTQTYQKTLAADEFSTKNVNATYGDHESMRVPVAEVIVEKLAEEREAGAKYRLIVFPKSYLAQGVWRFYTVTWSLYDIATNRKLWSYVYSGKHMVWAKEAENSEGRAAKFITPFVESLGKSDMM